MTKRIAKFYDSLAFLYPFIEVFLIPQKRRLVQVINSFPNGSLLEIGVGLGSHLSNYKEHTITGIDISQAMLKKAKKLKIKNLCLLKMDAEALDFPDESFNYVVIPHMIAVANHPELIVQEAFRVLKPNGKMIILNHFTPSNYLKYIDKAFDVFSSLFHFKSEFYVNNIDSLKLFNFEKEIKLGRFFYYKLLIYSKA